MVYGGRKKGEKWTGKPRLESVNTSEWPTFTFKHFWVSTLDVPE